MYTIDGGIILPLISTFVMKGSGQCQSRPQWTDYWHEWDVSWTSTLLICLQWICDQKPHKQTTEMIERCKDRVNPSFCRRVAKFVVFVVEFVVMRSWSMSSIKYWLDISKVQEQEQRLRSKYKGQEHEMMIKNEEQRLSTNNEGQCV